MRQTIRIAALPIIGSLLGLGALALAAPAASGQIGRSRPTSAQPSAGSPPARIPTGGGGSSPSVDRGRTPSPGPSTSVGIPNPRSGQSSLDRFNRTQESAAARNNSSSGRLHSNHYYPYYPYGYGEYGYGGGYPYPGYPDPYPYPNPVPLPRYPAPGDRNIAAARFDSPYYYCEDLPAIRYVSGGSVLMQKPKHLYAPTPVFKDGEIHGWRDLGADNYIADRNAEADPYRVGERPTADPALERTLNDIRDSWLRSDVEPLARHLSKDAPIAILLDGKYLYSLEAGDLLEITKAALASGAGLRFVFDHVHERANGVVALTGRHLYTDSNGKDRTVFFTYVVTRMGDDYVITQMATAADRL